MAIRNAAIATGGTTIFTCPGSLVTDIQEHAVTCIIFCNIDIADVNLDIFAYSQDTGNSMKLINSLTIPAGETFTFDTEKLVLSTGDYLTATASATNRLVATVSSMRVS
jgi:hypothetical protein